MKNMKVAKKLILSFSIVAILCAIVGGVGIFGMMRINTAQTEMYEVQTKPLPELAKILEYSQRLRIQLRNAALFTGNAERLKTVEAEMLDREAKMESFIAAYDATITDPNARKLFDEAVNLYKNEYKPSMDKVLAGAKAGADQADMIVIMDAAGSATNKMVDNFTECMNIKISAASAADLSNNDLYTTLLIIIIAVLIIAVAVSMLLALYISGMISKPLNTLTAFMNKAGTKGDISLTPEDVENISQLSQRKDELGQCIVSTSHFIKHMNDISGHLGSVANRDLTVEIALLSDNDVMGLSLNKMLDNLNNMFGEINSATSQVSSGSTQIADGAQMLAQGATEQAATVEQLSASVTEISEQTKQNAGLAREAQTLGNSIRDSAEQGNRQMEQMIQAVGEISEASQSIGKVIKIIDDIAFQTNILALNAAVEAARAGQHGKGFAVVADEVRNLAAKSAAAAKDTGELIETSIEKSEMGAKISSETAASLAQIVEGILKNSELVAQISKSSEEQSAAIAQVSDGIGQVSQVVQQNSATSEENAAASEEMSGQADLLQQLISQFRLRDSVGRGSAAGRSGSVSVAKPSKQETGFAMEGGKY